jgi:hypothetical protein
MKNNEIIAGLLAESSGSRNNRAEEAANRGCEVEAKNR